MSVLLGFSHNYGLDFPTGLGFAGITVALLGRNNPIGIAIGALLLAFLDRSSQILDLEGIAKEIVGDHGRASSSSRWSSPTSWSQRVIERQQRRLDR